MEKTFCLGLGTLENGDQAGDDVAVGETQFASHLDSTFGFALDTTAFKIFLEKDFESVNLDHEIPTLDSVRQLPTGLGIMENALCLAHGALKV